MVLLAVLAVLLVVVLIVFLVVVLVVVLLAFLVVVLELVSFSCFSWFPRSVVWVSRDRGWLAVPLAVTSGV